jgi:G3E family GTPase
MSQPAPIRIPVTILSGFLGSGKTTRLNALLRQPFGRRIAVILNELGAIGIDAAKLAAAEEFVELDGGCVCCTLNADLEGTLLRLRARGQFDHLVIETTGIADPLAVAWTLERGSLREGYRVDAIVTVVDTTTLARALTEGGEAALQIERADVLLLSKLDVAGTDAPAVRDRLRALNPVAPLLDAPRDATPWEALLDLTPTAAPRPAPTAAAIHAHGPAWRPGSTDLPAWCPMRRWKPSCAPSPPASSARKASCEPMPRHRGSSCMPSAAATSSNPQPPRLPTGRASSSASAANSIGPPLPPPPPACSSSQP